tara:strand:+ start:2593 stop:2817 length:225 start_codon:yes stop_codon:yes gene_type:complete
MEFRQYKKDGSCDLKFSLRERLIILFKGKIHFSDMALRHFGNLLVGMVANWQMDFKGKTKTELTHPDKTKIKVE